MIPIDYDVIVFREDKTYVAYCPELDISSCGKTIEHAKKMLKIAVRLSSIIKTGKRSIGNYQKLKAIKQ